MTIAILLVAVEKKFSIKIWQGTNFEYLHDFDNLPYVHWHLNTKIQISLIF